MNKRQRGTLIGSVGILMLAASISWLIGMLLCGLAHHPVIIILGPFGFVLDVTGDIVANSKGEEKV